MVHREYNMFGSIVHFGFSPDIDHYYAYIKAHFLSENSTYVSYEKYVRKKLCI
jgi:hypothetical protein